MINRVFDWQLLLGALLLGLGCQPDAASTDCQAGTESCECIAGGLCVAGLVCLSDVCVDLGETTGSNPDSSGSGKPSSTTSAGTTGGTTASSGTGTGTTGTTGDPGGSCVGACGGLSPAGDCWCDPACDALGTCCDDFVDACPGLCNSKFDCAADEVCSPAAGACVPALPHVYSIYVDLWEDRGPVCWDFDECLADVYFDMAVGGTTIASSWVLDDSLSASWSTPGVAELTTDQSFWLGFYDYDSLDANDFIVSYCYTDVVGACWEVPLEVLRDGYYEGYAGIDGQDENYWIELRFVPE